MTTDQKEGFCYYYQTDPQGLLDGEYNSTMKELLAQVPAAEKARLQVVNRGVYDSKCRYY